MKIIRNIFYANIEISSGYRYRDQFAIIPIEGLNTIWDRPDYLPFILEIKYDGPEVASVPPESFEFRDILNMQGAFYSNKLFQLLSLFNVFTVYHFRMNSSLSGWFFDWQEKRRVYAGYQVSNFEGEKTCFSEIKLQAKRSPESDYFQSIQNEFVLPEIIDELFDAFFNASQDFSAVVHKSARLYSFGRDLYAEYKSLSFGAYISSIETLAQFNSPKPHICPTCGTERYQPTRKFRDFLLKFSHCLFLNIKFIKTIYKMRSKIFHSGELFIWDLERTIFLKEPKESIRDEQWKMHILITGYFRTAIVNFLQHGENYFPVDPFIEPEYFI